MKRPFEYLMNIFKLNQCCMFLSSVVQKGPPKKMSNNGWANKIQK